MVAVGKGKTTLEDDLEAELARRGRRLLPNPDDAVGFYFRSDHFPFAKRGVPFLFPGSGWEIADRLPSKGDPEGLRYHRPSDEWGPELDFAAAAADLAVYHAVGARIADSRHWPAWKAGAEFAPLREASDERRRQR
jgi:Zn-dependent M28 family amino/carboxypeptidase